MTIDFKKYRHAPKISTGIIIISFLMPFFLVKCGGTTIATVSGVDMIVGADVHTSQQAGESFTVDPSIFAVVAMVCALAVAALARMKGYQSKMAALVVSCIGLISLLMLYFVMSGEARDVKKGIITIGLGIGYYLAFIGFLINGLFNGMSAKEDKKKIAETLDEPLDAT